MTKMIYPGFSLKRDRKTRNSLTLLFFVYINLFLFSNSSSSPTNQVPQFPPNLEILKQLQNLFNSSSQTSNSFLLVSEHLNYWLSTIIESIWVKIISPFWFNHLCLFIWKLSCYIWPDYIDVMNIVQVSYISSPNKAIPPL